MSVSQYTGHIIQTETCDNNTALPLVGVLVTCSGRIDDNMSKLKFLRHLWEIVVFRFVVYLLNMINTPNLIQNLTDLHFGIILTRFYINFLRQKHQIDVLYVSFNVWDSQVSSNTVFFLNSLFKSYLCMRFIFDICEEISAFVHSLEIWRHFDLSWISEIIVIN